MAALKLFCDLVETGSFTRAAERNFVSQSAVSQRLRALEHEYGQVLLDRGKGKGRVVPTEAGRILYEGGKALLAEAEELEARLRGLSEEIAGTVRVATVYSVGLHALPGRLKPFLAAHPKVNVHLEYSQTAKVYQDVLSGAVDVGIVACPTERSGVEIVPFGDEEMVVVCAPEHPFAQESKLRLAQLEGQPFIAFADDIPTRHLVDERLRAAGAKVHILMAFDNIETIKNLVEIGSGVALLPADTVRREVREGLLASVPLAPSDSFRRPEGLLVKKAGVRRAAVRAFIAAMCSAK
ncbi:MAG TPA: LysR family transcriptional regulator [Chthonomonadaceae bacterium]|nr:LysR family transcriptional regulator [Chthonomonadaceae bacterium]